MIRAALTLTIIILINILTWHELPLKDVVLNKFPLFFQNFRLITKIENIWRINIGTSAVLSQIRFIHTDPSVG